MENDHNGKSSGLSDLLKLSRDYASSVEKLQKKEARDNAAMPPLKEELVLWTAVAGLYYHLDDESVLKSLIPGTELLLFREPDNEHDPWAIMVTTKRKEMLGYVTRFKNETIARMMDYGYRFRAQVESEEDMIRNLPDKRQAPTEDIRIPFSIWLISEEQP